jgi:hypothetical protein
MNQACFQLNIQNQKYTATWLVCVFAIVVPCIADTNTHWGLGNPDYNGPDEMEDVGLLTQVLCWWPYALWLLILWLSFSKSALAKAVDRRSKPLLWIMLGLVTASVLARWDHEMMFYRTFWYEALRFTAAAGLFGLLFLRTRATLMAKTWPALAKILTQIGLWIMYFLGAVMLFKAFAPCA